MSDRPHDGPDRGPGSAGGGGSGSDPEWRPFFGYDEPYENQADAIEAAVDVGRRNGYLAVEGPCGTGKTMAALTAAATLVRRTDRYDNVLVVTPVKQQLAQFVDDLRALNAGLEEPLDGVALVGKADLCPYGREGAFPEDVGVHARCDDLREATADLVEADADGSAGGTAPASPAAASGVRDGADAWWDPERARELVEEARLDAETYRTLDGGLSTAGVDSPYPRGQPTAPERLSAGGNPPLYCPFEADWYARNKGSPVAFEAGEANVVTAEEYLPGAVERGTCPHRAMGVLLEAADVVIGNYNHLFDPKARPLVAPVLDERTFVIVDEAHRLEGRVRDLLSDTIGRHTLRRARGDLRVLLRRARERREARDRIESGLREFDVPIGAVERAAGFYDDVLEWLGERVDAGLRDRFDDLEERVRSDDLPAEDVEIPLREPEGDGPDELTAWAADRGYDEGFFAALSTVGKAVESTLDAVEPGRSPVCAAVGALFGAWRERDHTDYFREIELSYAPAPDREGDRAWERAYTPRLVCFNCMPARSLAEVFASLGGGVLMSATLEPLSVFREVSGLDALADGASGEERPVVERTYEPPFPEENRASWIVDAPPFTARNRGPPDAENRNRTREAYAQVLREVAATPGNVMLCLPSYREAAWAADRLRESVDKPVLVDEPSSAEATDDLKREFFSGGGKVLATSARGTLTEGVDYDGEKLSACAVVGVPLVNIGSPRTRAVKRAYAEAFGEDAAFEYALAIPAVRRARQAIGRVVRGPDERGVRVLADERYTADARYGSVHGYLPEAEREEFVRMTPTFLRPQLEAFWSAE